MLGSVCERGGPLLRDRGSCVVFCWLAGWLLLQGYILMKVQGLRLKTSISPSWRPLEATMETQFLCTAELDASLLHIRHQGGRGRGISELEATLSCMASSRPARYIPVVLGSRCTALSDSCFSLLRHLRVLPLYTVKENMGN